MLRIYWPEIITALFMFFGLIFSILQIDIGGALVGFGLGLACFDELLAYFLEKRLEPTTGERLFKTLMIAGGALYLLFKATAFLIMLLIGFGIIALYRHYRR